MPRRFHSDAHLEPDPTGVQGREPEKQMNDLRMQTAFSKNIAVGSLLGTMPLTTSDRQVRSQLGTNRQLMQLFPNTFDLLNC